MKTKILLFCAVILAVALIGLARPSTPVAEEAEATMGSLTTAGPNVFEKNSFPTSPEIQAVEQSQEQSQDEAKKDEKKKQQEQAQTQEEQKQKKQKKQPVVWTIKEGEKGKQEITIREGDTVKTIIVDKPIVIKEGADKKIIFITPDGKELKFLGEAPHLEIKADKLEFIKEGKIIKAGKAGGVVYIIGEPDIDIGKAVEVALEEIPVTVKVVEPAVDVSEAVKVALKEIPVTVKAVDLATPHITWVAEVQESQIREKLREVREKLRKVKEEKLDLQEVEKALGELEEELDKAGKVMSTVALKLKEKPEVFTIEPKKGDEEAAAENKLDIGVDIAEHAHKDSVKVVVKEKGSFSLYYEVEAGGKGREAYDRIVARVKKDLPEGFTLEPSFEEESGLITLKVNGPFGKGAPHDLVQKLADSIRDATKEKKE